MTFILHTPVSLRPFLGVMSVLPPLIVIPILVALLRASVVVLQFAYVSSWLSLCGEFLTTSLWVGIFCHRCTSSTVFAYVMNRLALCGEFSVHFSLSGYFLPPLCGFYSVCLCEILFGTVWGYFSPLHSEWGFSATLVQVLNFFPPQY